MTGAMTRWRRRIGALVGGFEAGEASRRLRHFQPSRAHLNTLVAAAGADITARATAKLIAYMKSNGYTHAYPHPPGTAMPEKPTWDLQAGYVLRNAHALPKSGIKRPWVVRQDFLADALDYRFLDRIEEDMVFGRVKTPAQLVG